MSTLWTPPDAKVARGESRWPLPNVLTLAGGALLKHGVGEYMALGGGAEAKVFHGPHGLTVLVSLDRRQGWEPLLHMSMSLPKGYPDWDLIYAVTRAVFGEHVDAMMPIPREEAFIHGVTSGQKSGRRRQVFHVVEMPVGWPRED